MMKKVIAICLALALVLGLAPAFSFEAHAASGVEINATNFPDEAFRDYVSQNFDLDGNGYLSTSERGKVEDIVVNNMGIKSLKGIKYFSSLKKLWCDQNELTTLNLSSNTALEELYCRENKLKSLNVSSNTKLYNLICGNNKLTELDVTNLSKLQHLYCNGNQLTELDVSHNPDMYGLNVSDNALTSLDISSFEHLLDLYCDNNQLRELDVPSVLRFSCSGNQLTELDLKKCPYLDSLDCSNNALTSLNVSHILPLNYLNCSHNALTSLSFRKDEDGVLRRLNCSDNALTTLSLTNFSYLWHLECANNALTSLDIHTLTELRLLSCQGNELPGLDISQNPNLIQVYLNPAVKTEEDGIITCYGESTDYAGAYLDGFIIESSVPVYTEITAKPTITKQPKNQTVGVGKKATFTVEATGMTAFQWQYRTSPEEAWKDVSSVAGKKATFTLTAKAYHDGYQYRCRVSNAKGNTYTAARTLTVITEKPSIVTQPKSQTVAAGKTAAFTVEAAGKELSYQWYYRTSSTGEWKAVSAAAGKTASYSFTTAARHNGYQYRCKVTNPAGSIYTGMRTLTVVTEKPAITTQPKSQTVSAGAKATFTVKASGESLTYQWYYRTSSTGEWKAVSAAAGKTATYSLTVAVRHNGYQYRCKVTNPMGGVYTKTVTLTVN